MAASPRARCRRAPRSPGSPASPRRGVRRGPAKKKIKVDKYHDELRKLMCDIHRRSFRADHKFTNPELRAVTPEKIMKYLKVRIYGREDVDPDVDPPVNHRRNTILF